MIFRLQSIAVVVLVSLFGLLLIVTAIFDDGFSQVEKLMTTSENCTELCLLGVRPGQSTFLEAMNQLQNHEWVSDVTQYAPGNGYGNINWGWSGKQPSAIDEGQRGIITFYYRNEDPNDTKLNDVTIQTVTIDTRIPIYVLQEWFGDSNTGNVNNRVDGQLEYTVYYDAPDGIISISTEVECPVTIASYWYATAKMRVSIGKTNDPYISPSAMIRQC